MRATGSAMAIACCVAGPTHAQQRAAAADDGRERPTRVEAAAHARDAVAPAEVRGQRPVDRPQRPYAFEPARPVRVVPSTVQGDEVVVPVFADKSPARLSPEERRQLRQNIQEVGRDVYRR